MGNPYTTPFSKTTHDLKSVFQEKKVKFEVNIVDRFWNPTRKLANLN